MAISNTRPNSLFASLAVTEEGSRVSPRLFLNVAMRSDWERRRRTTDETDASVPRNWRFICPFWSIWTKQSNQAEASRSRHFRGHRRAVYHSYFLNLLPPCYPSDFR